MDKSLKIVEDEWREKERRSMKFYASNEERFSAKKEQMSI